MPTKSKPKKAAKPTFRITYRMEVYIQADTQEEAEEKFEELDLTNVPDARWVETCSVEKQ